MRSVLEPTRITSRALLPITPADVSVVASTLVAGWASVRGLVLEGRLTDFYRHSLPLHVVAFFLSGTTMVEWKRSGRFTRSVCEPGSLTIIPAGGDHLFRTDRTARVLIWAIDPHRLQSIAVQEWGPVEPTVEIVEAFNSRNAEFWALGHRLAARLLKPIPGSRSYADALNTQLAIHLLWNYSSLESHDRKPAERPTDPRLRRVIEFIRSSLGGEIVLGELAEVADLSPNYLVSAFRRATGKTPHRYLNEQRVARACELLRDPHRSIVDVSLAVGFSSQSHLTTVFRRFLKTTPAAYRREVLGGHADGAGSFLEHSSYRVRLASQNGRKYDTAKQHAVGARLPT
jgi:AraC family transcriptional regulator